MAKDFLRWSFRDFNFEEGSSVEGLVGEGNLVGGVVGLKSCRI